MPIHWLLPVLWVVGLTVGAGLLACRGFERRRLVSWSGWRQEMPSILLRFAVAAVLLTALLWLHRPDYLFSLPRTQPGFWALVMLAYPVLSVCPQALAFRALYEYRYASLFGNGKVSWVVGAAVFSFAHLPFWNVWALGFTFVGGLMFLRTYRRTKSLPLSSLEHALYGDLLFTLGWGIYLVHGGTQGLLVR